MDNTPLRPLPRKPASLPTFAWWLVLCLVGLDYFSTLAYVPAMAVESAGYVAPVAALGVVIVTLLFALPLYLYVAGRSPHGEGATGLIERHLHGWGGKLIILVLLGFVTTDFIMTRTVSLADAARHLTHNPYWHDQAEHLSGQRDSLKQSLSGWLPFSPDPLVDYWDEQLIITLLLSLVTFALYFFLIRGFNRGFMVAASLVVGLYLLLTGFVVVMGLVYLQQHSALVSAWLTEVRGVWPQPPLEEIIGLIVIAVFHFPQLALGLSGFELSMASAPLVRGRPDDDPERPRGRIRNARKLLVVSALVMSLFFPASVFVVTLLVPSGVLLPPGEPTPAAAPANAPDGPAMGGNEEQQFDDEGEPVAPPPSTPQEPPNPVERGIARQRALAYLAHGGQLRGHVPGSDVSPVFGPVFGTVYDLSTLLILCLAGASVTISLREVVPHYLARFGMHLEWARRINVILHLFNLVILLVTIVFRASVSAQQWAYATSVLVLLMAAAFAVYIDVRRRHRGLAVLLSLPALVIALFFAAMAIWVLCYNPDGLGIALALILVVLVTGFVSRWQRSMELRFQGFRFADEQAQKRWEEIRQLEFQILVPYHAGQHTLDEKEKEIRLRHRLGPEVPILFIQAELGDPSDFYHQPLLRMDHQDGREIIHVSQCSSISHVLAAMALELCHVGRPPELHFSWSNESPLAANLHFLLLGEGNVPWLVHSLIYRTEPDPAHQPRVIIG